MTKQTVLTTLSLIIASAVSTSSILLAQAPPPPIVTRTGGCQASVSLTLNNTPFTMQGAFFYQDPASGGVNSGSAAAAASGVVRGFMGSAFATLRADRVQTLAHSNGNMHDVSAGLDIEVNSIPGNTVYMFSSSFDPTLPSSSPFPQPTGAAAINIYDLQYGDDGFFVFQLDSIGGGIGGDTPLGPWPLGAFADAGPYGRVDLVVSIFNGAPLYSTTINAPTAFGPVTIPLVGSPGATFVNVTRIGQGFQMGSVVGAGFPNPVSNVTEVNILSSLSVRTRAQIHP